MPDSTSLATLTIDLDALGGNYDLLKSRLGKNTACAAVVKADAYGLGAPVAAQTFYDRGCRTFFTAHIDEAATVAIALDADDVEVFVLCGHPPEEYGSDPRVIPVLSTRGAIAAYINHAREKGVRPRVGIQLDTGMNRLGLSARDITLMEGLARDIPAYLQPLDVRLVMSHFACADEQDHPMNVRQMEAFEAMEKKFPAAPRSLANSGGIFLGARAHHDIARPGIALYGGTPLAAGENPMKPVVRLTAKILQIRKIAAGESVGYSAAWTAPEAMNIAIVAAGYADGFFRCLSAGLSPGGHVYINETACPVVGRVSMDLIAVDVRPLDAVPREGDTAEIIGAQQSVDALAAAAGTISYEVLTNLSRRIRRVYKQEAKTA